MILNEESGKKKKKQEKEKEKEKWPLLYIRNLTKRY